MTRLLALLDVNLSLTDTSVELHTRKARTRGRYHVNGASFIRDETLAVIDYERTTRYQDVMLPELSVAAAWVMVMKMAYGLDGENRSVSLGSARAVLSLSSALHWQRQTQQSACRRRRHGLRSCRSISMMAPSKEAERDSRNSKYL